MFGCFFFFSSFAFIAQLIFTLALVRSPHGFASKFSPRAAIFLTWRKNKGLKKPGETTKHLNNNFSKSQALGTCYTNASVDTSSAPPMSFQNYLKDVGKTV